MKKAPAVLAIAIGAVCLPAAIFVATWASIGDAPWEDEDGAAQPQATATGWSVEECSDAKRTLTSLKLRESGDAIAELQIAINDNCP